MAKINYLINYYCHPSSTNISSALKISLLRCNEELHLKEQSEKGVCPTLPHPKIKLPIFIMVKSNDTHV